MTKHPVTKRPVTKHPVTHNGPVAHRPLPDSAERLPAPVTDSHTHLDSTEQMTGLTPAEAIARATEVNVTRLVQVGCDVASSEWAVRVAETHPEVIAAVALHPNDAARLGDQLPAAIDRIEQLLVNAHDRVRAVGETGIDHFRTTEPEQQQLQADSFARHIALAKTYDKTLVIHDRDAHREVLDILAAEGWPDRVVMHCFSGDVDHARACLDHGAHLSYPGVVTFRANTELQEAARHTPADRILVETDAPYLTPVPERGKPNASFLVPHTVRFLAELRGDDLADLCGHLHRNCDSVFGGW